MLLLILCEQGDPKGVMCSHDACMANALSVRVMFGLDDNDRIVYDSFLVDDIVGILLAFESHCCSIRRSHGPNEEQSHHVHWYLILLLTDDLARPDALTGSLTTTLQFARPTLYVAVPRVYEKMMEAINANLHKKSVCLPFLHSMPRLLPNSSFPELASVRMTPA